MAALSSCWWQPQGKQTLDKRAQSPPEQHFWLSVLVLWGVFNGIMEWQDGLGSKGP